MFNLPLEAGQRDHIGWYGRMHEGTVGTGGTSVFNLPLEAGQGLWDWVWWVLWGFPRVSPGATIIYPLRGWDLY